MGWTVRPPRADPSTPSLRSPSVRRPAPDDVSLSATCASLPALGPAACVARPRSLARRATSTRLRDGKWTDGFRRILQSVGVRIVLTPVQAPNANAYAERFVRSIREECLDRLILFGERRLFRALGRVVHYHGERNNQGLGNELITLAAAVAGGTRVRCRGPGELLRYYHRAA
jgi:transposase InsO family protein